MNIAAICRTKSEYLSKPLIKEKIDVVRFQEAHSRQPPKETVTLSLDIN